MKDFPTSKIVEIEIYDERMRSLISPDAKVVEIAEGEVHSEGPVYFPEDDSVVWSDVNVMLTACFARVRVMVFRLFANHPTIKMGIIATQKGE